MRPRDPRRPRDPSGAKRPASRPDPNRRDPVALERGAVQLGSGGPGCVGLVGSTLRPAGRFGAAYASGQFCTPCWRPCFRRTGELSVRSRSGESDRAPWRDQGRCKRFLRRQRDRPSHGRRRTKGIVRHRARPRMPPGGARIRCQRHRRMPWRRSGCCWRPRQQSPSRSPAAGLLATGGALTDVAARP